MSRRLSVLGGGSPFTLALVDALATAEPALPACHISFHGRSVDGLEAIAAYAAHRLPTLGWSADCTTRLETSLDGAGFVVQQIRFGGLDGRAADEAFARQCGLGADETLGPAAMHTVLRTSAGLRSLGAAIARIAPGAWVLNLANPLGISTALLAQEGVERVIGVCELPTTTAMSAADVLGCSFGELGWEYAGLNHRGFVVNLRRNGHDALPELVARLRGGTIGGMAAGTIAALHAIPTKYFQLVQASPTPRPGSRARELVDLRRQIMAELREAPGRLPPSLATRPMDWYALSVVPLLRACTAASAPPLIANVRTAGGIVEEGLADISEKAVSLRPRPRAPSAEVERWLEIFRRQERALLAMALEPTPRRIRDAVAADPAIPEAFHDRVAARLIAACQSPISPPAR